MLCSTLHTPCIHIHQLIADESVQEDHLPAKHQLKLLYFLFVCVLQDEWVVKIPTYYHNQTPQSTCLTIIIDIAMIKKKTYIVTTYNTYESITTRDTYSLLFLKLQYMRKGYRVFVFPTLWMAKVWCQLTRKMVYWQGPNVTFEKYIPGSDQITYHSPYDNFR